jgi:hypothetical protein
MTRRSALALLLFCAWLSGLPAAAGGAAAPAGAAKVYYAIEINGVVCGYSESLETRLRKEGREFVRQETTVFVMLSALGSDFNSVIKAEVLLDPVTRRIVHAATRIEQGARTLTFGIDVAGNEATLTSSLHPEPKTIPVAPAVLVGDDEKFLKLRREFSNHRASEFSCDIFEALEEEIQRSTFKKIGSEKVTLAGRTFAALVIEQTNTKTGIRTKLWLAPGHDDFIKYEVLNRTVYLSDRRVVDRIKVADMDASLFTKSNVAISDVQAITYMKLKVLIEPTGFALTAADLNGPGQTFSGTVEKNVIDGVLEISHRKYDGRDAPPFPPRFGDDERLKKYLLPERFIESDDPLLAARAKALTAGAADSWQAALRLSRWVADNISYAVPGGGSARKTYDIRGGECGGHSMLLAAFCRAAGIPARVVFGAMYAPNFGGGFGQHAWNEIYMGAAGWIPVDATAFETDYVDSGHIRVSELLSATASTFNAKRIEVLDYKLAGAAAAAGNPEFAPYLGMFASPQGGRTLTVLEKEGNLALDIPGKMVLPFSRADDRGRWLCKIAPQLYLVFKKDGQGNALAMELHQAVVLQKKPGAAASAPAGARTNETAPEGARAKETAPEVPAELAPYVGSYFFPALNADFTVAAAGGGLVVTDPTSKTPFVLRSPGDDGGWPDQDDRSRFYFEKDGQGSVTAMTIDALDQFQRGEQAADRVERTIQSAGLEAGLSEYAALQKAAPPGVLFNEGSFNQLGYRLLAAGKRIEAVAVFKLNVAAYPQSANAYDSLGEACMKDGQVDLAIENFKKSLQLDPGNKNARKMLEKLEGK